MTNNRNCFQLLPKPSLISFANLYKLLYYVFIFKSLFKDNLSKLIIVCHITNMIMSTGMKIRFKMHI